MFTETRMLLSTRDYSHWGSIGFPRLRVGSLVDKPRRLLQQLACQIVRAGFGDPGSPTSHRPTGTMFRQPHVSRSSRTTRSLSCKEAVSDMAKRRIKEGCILPSVSAVSKSALRALEERVSCFLPHGLMGAKRAEVLSCVPENGVPESLVVEAIVSDSGRIYLNRYTDAAKRSLKEAGVAHSKAVKPVVVKAYWDYLCETSGVPIAVPDAVRGKAADSKKSAAALLLFSSFGQGLLSKKPFAPTAANETYRKLRGELCECIDAVQKYGYYMRPDDPMNPSHDTAVRLGVINAYVGTMYKSCIYFMDCVDRKVLKSLGYLPSPHGPREPRTPESLLDRFSRTAYQVVAKGGTSALMRLTEDTICTFHHIMDIFSSQWRKKRGDVNSAILAALDLVTLVHHHCQYLLNLTLVGYACWLRDGLDDRSLMYATRNQSQYCNLFGQLAPTATSHSWADMEKGTEMWFGYAAAVALMRHGGPTPHYLMTIGSGAVPKSNLRRRGRPQSCNLPAVPGRSKYGASSGALFLGDTGMAPALENQGRLGGTRRHSGPGRRRSLPRCGAFENLACIDGNLPYALEEVEIPHCADDDPESDVDCPEESSRESVHSASADTKSSGSPVASEPESYSEDDSRNREDDEYWYANGPSCGDTYACGGDSDYEEPYFVEPESMGSGRGSDRDERDSESEPEDSNGSSSGSAIYVTMEEMEKCRLRQLREAADASELYQSPVGCVRAVPRDESEDNTYDVPSSPGMLRVVKCIAEHPRYDVPRPGINSKTITIKTTAGVDVIYDVPKPIPKCRVMRITV